MLQELHVCQEAAQPVLEAINKLEGNMDLIEAAVSRLEVDSKHLLQQLGLTEGPLQQGTSRRGLLPV